MWLAEASRWAWGWCEIVATGDYLIDTRLLMKEKEFDVLVKVVWWTVLVSASLSVNTTIRKHTCCRRDHVGLPFLHDVHYHNARIEVVVLNNRFLSDKLRVERGLVRYDCFGMGESR